MGSSPSQPGFRSSALVVGASTSIGGLVVDALRRRDYDVVGTYHRGSQITTEHDSATASAQGSIGWAPLDLCDAASLDCFVESVVPDAAPFDVVVFLAGVLPGRALAAYDDEMMHQVMGINFVGQAALLRRLLPSMRDGSHVLMVSSVSGERGSFDPIYAASKAAQIGFVKSLATWLAPRVRVNAIAPALIENSSMFNAMAPERRAHHLAQTPTGRLTTREELADLIVNLCEPVWANLNGQVIRINGGAHV